MMPEMEHFEQITWHGSAPPLEGAYQDEADERAMKAKCRQRDTSVVPSAREHAPTPGLAGAAVLLSDC
jgi:hypothetical protein